MKEERTRRKREPNSTTRPPGPDRVAWNTARGRDRDEASWLGPVDKRQVDRAERTP